MPIHDWTRVPADAFHMFHNTWLTRLYNALNGGLMPDGYYALLESEAGEYVPDLLTLREAAADRGHPDCGHPGGTAVATAPPAVALRREYGTSTGRRVGRRHLTVRRTDGNRLVAIVEIVSASNKDRAASVAHFVGKVVSAVEAGVHVLVVDLHPPTPRDPDGLPGEIGREWGDDFTLAPATPLTLASDFADDPPVAYIQLLAVGDNPPDMPLFLDPGHYVSVPLDATYTENFDRLPAKYRERLAG